VAHQVRSAVNDDMADAQRACFAPRSGSETSGESGAVGLLKKS
jgi:hypothetical protein